MGATGEKNNAPSARDRPEPNTAISPCVNAYVDQWDVQAMGLMRVEAAVAGPGAIDWGDLLKLYLYGDRHRTR